MASSVIALDPGLAPQSVVAPPPAATVIPLPPLPAGQTPAAALPANPMQEDQVLEQIVAQDGARYRLRFGQSLYPDLDARIQAASALARLIDRPPRTAAGLRRRIARDEEELAKVLRALGFYAGRVRIDLGRNTGAGGAPLDVLVRVDPGPEFLLSGYSVIIRDRGDQRLPLSTFPIADLPLRLGSRAEAEGVLGNEERLLLELANGGYPFARVLDRQVLVDHAQKTLEVTLSVASGARSRLSAVSYRGLERVNPDYVARQLGLAPGRIYSQAEIDAAKERLLATGLFSSVTVSLPPGPDGGGSVPIAFNLRERPAQQIRAGLTLSSKSGPSAFAEYQHRNLLGEGQSLLARGEVALDEISGRLSFRWPDILDNQIDFIADLSGSYSDRNQLVATSVEGLLALERRFNSDRTRVRAGVGLEYLQERAGGATTDDYLLLSAPLSLDSDFSNDRLDPTRGFRLKAGLVPYIALNADSQSFYDLSGRISGYQPLPLGEGLTLTGWLQAQSLLGQDISAIPLSKQVTAGGQGSVRAFDRGEIRPRAGGTLGGLAKLEGGAELRWRINPRFGAALFAEAALIDDDPLLRSPERPFIGLGAGGRYHSALGPVRLDLGIPVSESFALRDWRLNVGFGQAF